MAGAVGRPRVKPGTTSSRPGLQPRASGLPPFTLALAKTEPLEGQRRGACFLPRGRSWVPLAQRMYLETEGRGSRAHLASPPFLLLSKKFATQNKHSGWNHKKEHLGSFINSETNHLGSLGPFPKHACRGAFGPAMTGGTEVLNARKLL